MASCDLRSQEDIATDEPSKDLNDTEVEHKTGASGATKIPGPVMLDASGSFISLSNRQYTSVMELAKRQSELRISLQERNNEMTEKQKEKECAKESETKVEKIDLENNPNLMNQTDDSGVQLDTSATDISVAESESVSEDLPTASPDQPILQHILDKIPSSTTRLDLHRAEQQSLRELQRAVAEMEADVAAHSEALDLEIQKQLDEEQSEMVLSALEMKQNPSKVPDNIISEDVLSKNVLTDDPVLDNAAIDNSVNEDLALEGSVVEDAVANDPVVDYSVILNAVPDNSLVVDSTPENLLTVESVPHDLITADLLFEDIRRENAIAMDLMNDALVLSQLMEGSIQEPSVEKEKVQITIHARLTPASSTTGSSTDRKMVRLEQLLDAENNIDLLRQLLDSDTYNDVVDSSESDTADSGADKAKVKDEGKVSGFLQTLLQVLCSRKMLQPILLCGVAVGLIYFLRKV